MKYVFILVALLNSSMAVAEQTVGCFSSGKINVKFVQITQEGLDFAYVKYQNSNQAIPLVLIGTVEEPVADERPSAFTTQWQEQLHGKINGEYRVMSQGARFYKFNYISKKKKLVAFSENLDAYNNERSDCQWQ